MLKRASGLVSLFACLAAGSPAVATSLGADPSPAAARGLRAEDYRLDELRRAHQHIARGEHDNRLEYEGLMTDALLRLFRDLRPLLASAYPAGGDDGGLRLGDARLSDAPVPARCL